MQPTAEQLTAIRDLDAWVKEQRDILAKQEFKLLQFLADRSGTVVTTRMIMDHFYPGGGAQRGPKIIDVLICKIRKKTKTDELIESVWGRGYIIRTPDLVQALPAVNSNGAHLWKVHDLPDPMTQGGIRWVKRLKLKVLKAWSSEKIHATDLQLFYDMTLDELHEWREAFVADGEDGLKQTYKTR